MLRARLYTFSILPVMAVLLALLKKDYWLFRVFDYPTMQKLVIILLLCLCWIFVLKSEYSWYGYATVALLIFCMIHLAFLIYPFTPLGKKMIQKVKNRQNQPTLDLLFSNVYQYNRKYAQVLQLIERRNSDIVFLLETDQLWLEQVKILQDHFPYYMVDMKMERHIGSDHFPISVCLVIADEKIEVALNDDRM